MPFKDALAAFKTFTANEGKPTSFLWITQDRVRVACRRIWIFRPNELSGNELAERFYESVRSSNSSIKLLGIDTFRDRYITCIEEMPSPPHHPNQLYMSLFKSNPFRICSTSNRFLWILLNTMHSRSRRDRLICESISLNRTIKNAE